MMSSPAQVPEFAGTRAVTMENRFLYLLYSGIERRINLGSPYLEIIYFVDFVLTFLTSVEIFLSASVTPTVLINFINT